VQDWTRFSAACSFSSHRHTRRSHIGMYSQTNKK
jgi:hypothetical protein